MAKASPPDRVLLLALLALTAVTGLVDAASYLGLGHVFTANMTGNVVFLGFAMAGAPGLSIPRCSTALVGFFLGALLGGGLSVRMGSEPRHRRASTAFTAEAVLLLAAAATSSSYAAARPDHTTPVYAVTLLTALAMGMRNATVRSLAVPDLTTTVLTLTVTSLAADSVVAGGRNPRWRRRIASILMMSAGAASGVLLLKHSLSMPLAVGAVVTCACALAIHLHGRGDA